jgi:starch synthase
VLAHTADRAPIPALSNLSIYIGPHRFQYSVSAARDPHSALTVYLIECPALYDRAQLYGSGADEHLRFILLTRAALEACQRLQFAPHIVHCHDWHGAFAPLFLRTIYGWDALFRATKTVLTIHNLGYQGDFPASQAADLGLGAAAHYLHQDDLRAGRVNALRHGILYADLVTTVSPTYAREICTPGQGMGLDVELRARGAGLRGILNGVDYVEWNPAADRYVPHPFSAEAPQGKRAAKAELFIRLGLMGSSRTPLLGLISRLVWQKGIDLLTDTLPGVLHHRDACFVALGTGEPPYESALHDLQQAFPGRVVFHRGYSDELAHWIEAASDVFLMPSRYEPCGLNQMYSLRYGTVPVVHRTGGLADSVTQFDPATGEGTGIVFDHADAAGVRWAVDRALDLHLDTARWALLQRNGMQADFSAERQGAQYVEAYRTVLGPSQA